MLALEEKSSNDIKIVHAHAYAYTYTQKERRRRRRKRRRRGLIPRVGAGGRSAECGMVPVFAGDGDGSSK